MRVVSGLADVDFHVGRIVRDGPRLVVESRADDGLPTRVHVDRDDIVAAMRALFASPSALWLVLTAPLRRSPPPAPGRGADGRADLNNPWQ